MFGLKTGHTVTLRIYCEVNLNDNYGTPSNKVYVHTFISTVRYQGIVQQNFPVRNIDFCQIKYPTHTYVRTQLHYWYWYCNVQRNKVPYFHYYLIFLILL